MISDTVSDSFAACQKATRHHAKTFYFASRALPRLKRRRAYAIYAFCRYVDDQIDQTDGGAATRQAAASVRALADRIFTAPDDAVADNPQLDWLPAFVMTVRECAIPPAYFYDLLRGVEMDQGPVRIETWDQLRDYCYCVASVVGLIMVHVFTEPKEDLLVPAADLGTAMQLTNILRDVGEDWQRNRIYLPREELARFGVNEADIAQGRSGTEAFRNLMRFQIGRARTFYLNAEPGIRRLPRDGAQLTVWLMRTLYATILDEIEKGEFNVFTRRARVSLPKKVRLAAGVLFRYLRMTPP